MARKGRKKLKREKEWRVLRRQKICAQPSYELAQIIVLLIAILWGVEHTARKKGKKNPQ